MSTDEVGELAAELARQSSTPGDATYLRRGAVTAVQASTVTITLGGAPVTAVPYYSHLRLTVGDVVDVLFDGPSPRIVGVIGATPAAPTWRVIGAAGNPTFLNGWTNQGGADQTAAYLKDPNGFVHLRGLVRGGPASQAIFTLPAGNRPSLNEVFPVITNTTFTRGMLVVDAGNGAVWALLEAGSAFISLAGVTFYAP